MAVGLLVACSSRPVVPPTTVVRPLDLPFLIAPAEGYPLAAAAPRLSALQDAFDALRLRRATEVAVAGVETLLAAEPSFHPAIVLQAQLALLDDRGHDALELVSPVAEGLPEYLAAQVVRGFAAESADEPVAAFEAFRAAAEMNSDWSDRAHNLQARAVEVQLNRIDDALARGHVERGAEALTILERWAPTDPGTAEANWWLAVALNDPAGERLALDTLLTFDPDRRDALERLAALDVEAGDLQAGLQRYEGLMARFPDDQSLFEDVERARFRWRLSNLPPVVSKLRTVPKLSRAEFATLLYWLVPEVRYAELRNPPIATDILHHEQRNEIVRVVNLRLLRVDETVHRFRPDSAVQRRRVLGALLTLLARAPTPLACLESASAIDLNRSTSLICETASRCGLITDAGDCLPTARITGEEALDLFRHTLDQLGE